MAYNVFKRPMFKRGGSTTGTGIMSHVEPRVKAAFGFPNFGVTQMPPQSQLEAFRKAEEERQLRRQEPSIFAGPAFSMPEDYPGTVNDYRQFLRQQEKDMKEFEKVTTGGIADIKPGQTSFDAVFAPIDEMAKQNAEKRKLLETKEVVKDEPAYEGTDIKSEVKKESEMLRELLKDDKYSRGEAALIIAGALAEPGSMSDKIKKATELAAPVARKAREEDKAITLAAYKLAKEKEQQQIKAGKLPDTLMALKKAAEVEAERIGGDRDKIYGDKLIELAQSDTEKRAIATLQDPRIKASITDQVTYIDSLNTQLQDAIKNKKNTKKLEKQLQEEIRKFDLSFRNDPYFNLVYPQYSEKNLGYAKGGRVMKAVGGDAETDDIITSQVSFGGENKEDATVVEKPVENLSFAELRDRLPPEITDDVVQMLASSEEALQDFAYIRTQDDINSFNIKYGVNLVIPPTQA